MPKVYVVQEVEGKNISSADIFGEIEVLLNNKKQITYSAGAVADYLNTKLSSFKETDYLLLIGDPVAIGLAVAIAAKWSGGKMNLLKWDKQSYRYIPVKVVV
jgi:hypothetical protein